MALSWPARAVALCVVLVGVALVADSEAATDGRWGAADSGIPTTAALRRQCNDAVSSLDQKPSQEALMACFLLWRVNSPKAHACQAKGASKSGRKWSSCPPQLPGEKKVRSAVSKARKASTSGVAAGSKLAALTGKDKGAQCMTTLHRAKVKGKGNHKVINWESTKTKIGCPVGPKSNWIYEYHHPRECLSEEDDENELGSHLLGNSNGRRKGKRKGKRKNKCVKRRHPPIFCANLQGMKKAWEFNVGSIKYDGQDQCASNEPNPKVSIKHVQCKQLARMPCNVASIITKKGRGGAYYTHFMDPRKAKGKRGMRSDMTRLLLYPVDQKQSTITNWYKPPEPKGKSKGKSKGKRRLEEARAEEAPAEQQRGLFVNRKALREQTMKACPVGPGECQAGTIFDKRACEQHETCVGCSNQTNWAGATQCKWQAGKRMSHMQPRPGCEDSFCFATTSFNRQQVMIDGNLVRFWITKLSVCKGGDCAERKAVIDCVVCGGAKKTRKLLKHRSVSFIKTCWKKGSKDCNEEYKRVAAAMA